MIFFRVEGLTFQPRRIPRLTRRGIRNGNIAIGKDLIDWVERETSKPKSGRIYRVRRNGQLVRHVASSPAETHANLSGDLTRSTRWIVRGDDLHFGFLSNPPAYADFIENGTQKMRARKTLSKAVQANKRNAETRYLSAIMRELLRL